MANEEKDIRCHKAVKKYRNGLPLSLEKRSLWTILYLRKMINRGWCGINDI